MAIVLPQSNHTLLLIEIEESAASPKTILGDIFATWLGEHFTFQGKRDLQFGVWTTLVVLFHGKLHDNVIAFLTNKLNYFQSSQFGALVAGTFESEADLEKKLTQQIELVLANLKSPISNL